MGASSSTSLYCTLIAVVQSSAPACQGNECSAQEADNNSLLQSKVRVNNEAAANRPPALQEIADRVVSDHKKQHVTVKTDDDTIHAIEFGGDFHGDGPHYSYNGKYYKYIYRPEFIKTTACNGAACQTCKDKNTCWHGVSATKRNNNGNTAHLQQMTISVPQGSAFTKYVAEAWVRCKTDDAAWTIRIGHDTHGSTKVFVDGTEVTTWNAHAGDYAAWSNIFAKNTELPMGSAASKRLQAVFTPTDSSQPASATVSIIAHGVDPIMDDCMASKLAGGDCLEILGEGSAAMFKLRNSNQQQYQCLTTSAASTMQQHTMCVDLDPYCTWYKGYGYCDHTFTSYMETNCQKSCSKCPVLTEAQVCDLWRTCLAGSGKTDEVLAMVGAGLGGSTGLLEDAVTHNHQQVSDPAGCLHPENEDPESWDCDCAEGMKAECAKRKLQPPCTDEPTKWMQKKGHTCQKQKNWLRKKKCKNGGNKVWKSGKYCKFTCWQEGVGYDGDDCSVKKDEQKLHDCFKDLMCESANICPSWKASHCPGFLMQLNSTEETALSSEEQMEEGGAALDDTLEGKRSCGGR